MLSSFVPYFFDTPMPAYAWILAAFTLFIIGFLLGIPFGHYLLGDLSRVNFEYLNSAGTWAGSIATTVAVALSLYYGYRDAKARQLSLSLNFNGVGPVFFINVVNTSPTNLYFHSALLRSGGQTLYFSTKFLSFDPPITSGLVPGQLYSMTLYSRDFCDYARAHGFSFSHSATFEFRTTMPASGSIVSLSPSTISSLAV